MFDSLNEQRDGHTWRKKLRDFVWFLSVAKKDELAQVYEAVADDARFWEFAVEVHAIFGRVYVASLAVADQK